MSAAITCTSCNRPLRVPESVLGQTVQCPLCLDEFTAQADPAAEAAARAAETARRAAAPRPQPVAIAARAHADAEQTPLAPILDDEPVALPPILEAVPQPLPPPRGGPKRAFVFPVIVTRDPDRILRGPMDGELTVEGLYLRKIRQPPTFAAVGGRARYLGTNRLIVTVEGREVELAVVKRGASNYHLARDAADFLNRRGPFPNGRAYNLPWYLYLIPALFLALPFVAVPFGLITDGFLGGFLWTVIALALGGATLIIAAQARLRPRARLITGLSVLGAGALLPLLAIPITPRYSADPSLWSSFTPSAGDFTVQMPGTPSMAGTMSRTNGYRIYEVNVAIPEERFDVYVAAARVNNGFGFNATTQGYADAKNLLNTEYYLTSPYPIYPMTERPGYRSQPYEEFFYQIPSSSYGSGPNAGKSLAARVYVVNGEVVTLAVLGPRVKLDGYDVVKFFNSIQFTTPSDRPAVPNPPPQPTTVKGIVVGTNWNQLTLKTDVPGGQTVIAVPAEAPVVIDGKQDRVQNIQINSTVTVTEKDGKVVGVDAETPAPAPPPAVERTYTGRIIRANPNGLTLVTRDGARLTVVFVAETKVTIDGQDSNRFNIQANANWIATVTVRGDQLTVIDIVTPK